MQKNAFHHAVIGGQRLYGVLSAEGPAIVACSLDGEQPAGPVALVVWGLRRFLQPHFGMRSGPWGWYIVKYQSEARIYLDGFTDGHVRRLHSEFGLLPVDHPTWQRDPRRGLLHVAGLGCPQGQSILITGFRE